MGSQGLSALAGALALGTDHERAQAPDARRARGAHFTPYDVARGLVDLALDGVEVRPSFTACDPACGGAVFLLAVAEALVARGWSRHDALRAVHGSDVDARTVDVARAALAQWGGVAVADVRAQVVTADALVDDPFPGRRFDLVAGNPPFLGQMQSGTARRGAAREVAPGLGAAGAPYVDTSALFLTRALELVADGGRVVLIQPHSILGARDARVVRDHVLAHAELRALWWSADAIFDAGVRVCAPVLERRGRDAATRATVTVATGRTADEHVEVAPPERGGPWSPLVRGLLGVPAVQLPAGPRLGDLVTATAGFRDEYYGLVGAVHEAPELHGRDTVRLVTSGLVDVLGCGWGARPARFARTRYAAPAVDVAALDGRVRTWADAMRVPKLLLATQTKVLEAFVDDTGEHLPCTPVIAVHAPPAELWRVAAVLAAPCISAHALAHVAGAALGTQAIKLAARQVLELPLPVDAAAWAEGAALAAAAQGAGPGPERAALLDELGAVMDRAFGCDDPAVLAWWTARRGR